MSKKKWGKSATKTEKIIRDAVPKPDALKGIDEYLGKARSVTCYDLANRFNIRMSVARKILRDKEAKGEVIPYIRESGFVVYTTHAEIEKREGGVPIMISDALEEVASSVSAEPVITEEMDLALSAAGSPGSVKPSKLAWKRREAGEKKETRKDTRPEVIVEPLDSTSIRSPEAAYESSKEIPSEPSMIAESVDAKGAKPKKATDKKEEKPKKAADKKEAKPKKAADKKEEKPKKAADKKDAKPKKAADKKEEKPKKAAEKKDVKPKKAADKKEEKPKKAAEKKDAKPKKAADKKEEKPKKSASKDKTK